MGLVNDTHDMHPTRSPIGYLVAAVLMVLGTISVFGFGPLFGGLLMVLCASLAVKAVRDAEAAAPGS